MNFSIFFFDCAGILFSEHNYTVASALDVDAIMHTDAVMSSRIPMYVTGTQNQSNWTITVLHPWALVRFGFKHCQETDSQTKENCSFGVNNMCVNSVAIPDCCGFTIFDGPSVLRKSIHLISPEGRNVLTIKQHFPFSCLNGG